MRVLLAFLLPIAAISCQAPEYRLKDLTAIEVIDSVTVHNNSGDYELRPNELNDFKAALGEMHYLPNASLKMGSIGLSVYTHGHEHYLTGSTHGQYLAVSPSFITKHQDQAKAINGVLIFQFDHHMNLDDYRKRPQ